VEDLVVSRRDITRKDTTIGGKDTTLVISIKEMDMPLPYLTSPDGGPGSSVQYELKMDSFCELRFHTKDSLFIGTPLPVELLTFEGKHNPDRNANELTWTTASEINTNRFEIERSLDAQHWTTIGSVPAKGTTATISAYNFDDLNPATGYNYYRLKTIDNDGTFEYSWIVPINVADNGGGNGITQIFPNPTQGTLNVWLTSTQDQTAVFHVYDVLGRAIAEVSKDLKTGSNRLEFSFSSLSGGTYIISYIDATGEKQYAKFVKE
jgi:hypothetical protein